MEEIIIPSKISLKEEGPNEALIYIEPCYTGYGTTIGNALRRVLLSSLSGGAVSAIRIKGVDHEFSTIKNIKEDVIQIISNLKSLKFNIHTDKPVKLELHSKGKKVITAADIEKDSNVDVIDTNLKIAEATSKDAELDMEMIVEKGMGYVPVEQKDSSELEIGMIAVDSIFTPVLAVGYEIKNIRVGKRTDFDQLRIRIKTDGTVSPLEALAKSARILIDQFNVISDVKKIEQLILEKEKMQKAEKEIAEKKEEEEADDISISELNFSTRTFNALDNAKIRKLKDLASKKPEKLLKLSGFGQNALNEVEKALKKHNLELKKD